MSIPLANQPCRRELRVLVVEDDPEVRCLLEREIEDWGHPVTAVENAEQALEALRAASYAVVFTDIRMPGMDGVQLTQEVKQNYPEIEVILITAYGTVDSASRAVRLGAADYLTKPLGDINRIGESLDRALQRHLQGRDARQQQVSLQAGRETISLLIERLALGVMLINEQGQVILQNAAARAIIAQADGLALAADGRLLGSTPARTAELRQLIRTTTEQLDSEPVGGLVGGAIAFPRPSGRAPLSILVSSLRHTAGAGGSDEPNLALFVSDPEQRAETTEELLCRLYALTPTEARLAAILMQGRSVEQAARELGVSTNTIRTHLKRVFAKTNTSRQGELISLLLSGPALLCHGQRH